MEILKAEKEIRASMAKEEAPKPVPTIPEGAEKEVPAVDKNLPFVEQVKAAWEKDGKIQDEFGGDFEAFAAYADADRAGVVHILSK